jgi:PAS domain S-box-containing protein
MRERRVARLLGVLGLATSVAVVHRLRRTAAELSELQARHDRTLADRERSEAALRHSSETFANLVANVPGVIFRCLPDQDWTAYFVSDAIEPLTGHAAAEFLGSCVRSLASIVHPDDVENAQRARRDATAGEAYSVSYRVLREDGGLRYVQERGRAIVDDAGGICCIDGAIFDVTDRRLLEERLAQTQRLEAIGRLTGGIAHDFNNVLTAIRGYAELLHATLSNDPARARDVSEIQRAAESASELVGQLLTFGRRRTLNPVVLDLNTLLGDLEAMLRASGWRRGRACHGDGSGARPDQSRSCTARAGDREPRRQRARRDACRRPAHDRDAERPRPRRRVLRHAENHRHGRRHRRGDAATDLRALLHH